ncbi:STAS domain-containing protein [Oryzomonas japonica]|nr:STAS domain-containing protein [Oryzomonas japonica]
MKINISGAEAHLEGDWIIFEVTQGTLDSLAVALQQLEVRSVKRLQVDCRQVNAIDATGQQILSVWLHCLRLRGTEPVLVNCPENLHEYLKSVLFRDGTPEGAADMPEQNTRA